MYLHVHAGVFARARMCTGVAGLCVQLCACALLRIHFVSVTVRARGACASLCIHASGGVQVYVCTQMCLPASVPVCLCSIPWVLLCLHV